MYVYMCVYMNTHTHKIYDGGSLVTKSCPTLMTPWTIAHQSSLSMGFPRKEYWSGLPFPSPGDLPSTRIKPRSPVLQAVSFCWATGEVCMYIVIVKSLSCPLLCNAMDCSLPGSSVHGIFQTRVLEWVVISFSTYMCIYMCIYIHIIVFSTLASQKIAWLWLSITLYIAYIAFSLSNICWDHTEKAQKNLPCSITVA